jgi:hypothetical protein
MLGVVRNAVVALIVTVGASYLAWRMYGLANRFSAFGDETASTKIRLAPIAYAGALALALSAAASLLVLIEALTGWGNPTPRREEHAE